MPANAFEELTMRESEIAANISRGMMTVLVDSLRIYKTAYPDMNERTIASAATTLVNESVKVAQALFDAVTN